jgi:Conserved oligomeric complex COG6.
MPDVLLLPQVGLLLSSVHRSTVQHRSFEVIAAVYKQLYESVHDPENLYQNPAVLMPRSPDEVSKLLVG